MGPRWRRTFEREALHGAGDEANRRESEPTEDSALIRGGHQSDQDGDAHTARKAEQDLVALKEKAIKSILGAKNSTVLMQRIEKMIDESWVADIDDLPGNIYSIAGMGDLKLQQDLFYVRDKDDPEKKIWSFNPREWIMERARMLGFLCIMFIQIVGPPAIFMSAVMAWGIMSEDRIHWDRWHPLTEPDFYDWAHISLTKILATVFIMCFILNSLFVLMDEHKTWNAIDRTFAYLHQNDKDARGVEKFKPGGSTWISVGAVVNCWVVVWCCLDSFVVIGASGSPKNVLFDALGLIFLYNLDDTSGDLGFVSADDWPGAKFAWIYHWVQTRKPRESSQEGQPRKGPALQRSFVQNDDRLSASDNTEKGLQDIEVSWQSWLVNVLFLMTEFLLMIMAFCLPALACLTSFSRLMEDLE